MTALLLLRTAVQRAFRHLARLKDVREAEVFASSSDHLLCRLNYTSEIPCHGVEEPKSSDSFGVGIRAVFTDPEGPRIGFGSAARDLSDDGVRRALERARSNAVTDVEFISLPKPPSSRPPSRQTSAGSYDPAFMNLTDHGLVDIGWRTIYEALHTVESSEALMRLAGSSESLTALGVIIGGDVSVYRQRIAIASTHHPKVQTDESAFLTSSVTAMIESRQAKGTGYEAVTHLSEFKGKAGQEAAQQAIAAVGGQRVPTGTYTVILGPQPISDLMVNLILPSLSVEAFCRSRSAFLGELHRPVAWRGLTVFDDGARPGLIGSRRITCEGLPTGRTVLIRHGILEGLLSDYYETQRLLHDPRAREKLGVASREYAQAISPRNGFRLSSRGHRQFDVTPSVAATNVFIEGTEIQTREHLFQIVRDGVYIGRIWYTYPFNGLRAGDFTCTVVGDSFLIRDGRIAEPVQGNTVRMTGNIRDLLHNIVGIGAEARPIAGWGADEVIYAPDIAVRHVRLSEIAQFMQTGIQ